MAWAFAELRQGELPAASVAVTTVARSAITLAGGGPGALAVRPFRGLFSAGYAYVADPDRDLLLDQAAASLTRYPPGLLSALEPHGPGRHHRRPGPPRVGPPLDGRPRRGRARHAAAASLELRVEALRLL